MAVAGLTFMLIARIRSSHRSVHLTGSIGFSSLSIPKPPAVPWASASMSFAGRDSKYNK